MSVASDITALTTKLSTIFDQIKTALAAKGVSGAPADYAAVPAKITAIVTGTGIDTSDATATKEQIFSGATAYVDGTKVTGEYVPLDTSDANAAAGDIRSGKSGYVNDSKVDGTLTTRSNSDLYVEGFTVKGPPGIYDSTLQKGVQTVTQATPSISLNTSTGVVSSSVNQSSGYVTGGVKSATYNLTTQAAQTIHPSASNQTISSGVYLTGAQTIKGVQTTNLISGNIKSGVTIKIGDSSDDDCVATVTGTYSGGNPVINDDEVQQYRTGGGAMTFTGLSVPSGSKLIGIWMRRPQLNSGVNSGYIQNLVAINDSYGNTTAIVCHDNSDMGWVDAYDTRHAVSLEISSNGTSGAIYVDTDKMIGFSSGVYYVSGIFA